jgi:hypothetical protein
LLSLAAAIVGAAMLASIGAGVALGGPWTLKKPPAMTRTSLPAQGLSLEMPAPIAQKLSKEEREGVKVFVYGELGTSPMVVEIMVVNIEQPPRPEELDEFIEAMRTVADDSAPEKAVRLDKARIETAGARKVVLVEHETKISGEAFMLRTYFLVVGARELIVRSYTQKGKQPAGWKGIEEKVVASIEER